MWSTLQVTTPAAATRLTTLDQLKADLALDDSQDAFLSRVIDICSEQIAAYLRPDRDEEEMVTLGRETITEVIYDFGTAQSIQLGRLPVASLVSVAEGNSSAVSRLISGNDGAISSSDATFTSVSGPAGNEFSAAYVGKSITIAGAAADGADLSTTIASVTSATEIELAAQASTTVSNATYTVENPSFGYVVRKQGGRVFKRLGGVTAAFMASPVTVVYSAGWLLPGETGRNLPKTIEDACIMFCSRKREQLQSGGDFIGDLTAASVDGVGSFQFGSSSTMAKGYGIPMEIRAILDRYRDYHV